eukprot:PLAT14750.1.p1 GENE.PLAT14750.1~~PLAT14750.1.p1  ORF type:complete len:189 (-),score=74.82 PLAT14750.1:53-619(-)
MPLARRAELPGSCKPDRLSAAGEEAGCHHALLRALQRAPDDTVVQHAAVTALGWLARSDAVAGWLAEAGGVAAFTAAQRSFPTDPGLQRVAAATLCRLPLTRDAVWALCEADAPAALLAGLSKLGSSDALLVQLAFQALLALCQVDELRLLGCVADGTVATRTRALAELHAAHDDVQALAAALLSAIE